MPTTVECAIATAVPGTIRAWNNPSTRYPLPEGPWLTEPTKVQWVDEATKMPCLIVRGPVGGLCGYAGVSSSHPLHGKGYDGLYEVIDVHGGLTYADGCAHNEDECRGVCHIPEPGTPDDVWWFGFDCAHCFDFCPGIRPLSTSVANHDEAYRDLPYVAAEVTRLAAQLAAMQEAA